MSHYLLDTNLLVYYFNGDMDSVVKSRVSQLLQDSFQISVISQMEFLGFPFNEQEKPKAKQFIAAASVRNLTDAIVQRVIDIRQTIRIKLPDAIIAATAMQQGAILATRNTQDFKALDLTTYNPFDYG
jgi:predicted nucleic acid-binding protein